MREFIIDFTADAPIVPGTVIGRQGENNATSLKIKIPDEMLNNEAVELVSLAAQIGAGYVARSELIVKAETVTVKLDSRMTAVNSLSIQLEGYDSAKSLLVKSAKIDNLIFEKSVTGETPELEDNAGVIADIAANTSARHTHENAETLDKLGDSGGTLTYKGREVGSGGSGGSGGKEEIYIGSGEMPEGYVLQIDPEGTADSIPTKTSELENDSGFITSSDLPTKTSQLINDSGFITVKDLPDPELPSVTEADNGKVLKVVNGVWAAALIPNAEGVGF